MYKARDGGRRRQAGGGGLYWTPSEHVVQGRELSPLRLPAYMAGVGASVMIKKYTHLSGAKQAGFGCQLFTEVWESQLSSTWKGSQDRGREPPVLRAAGLGCSFVTEKRGSSPGPPATSLQHQVWTALLLMSQGVLILWHREGPRAQAAAWGCTALSLPVVCTPAWPPLPRYRACSVSVTASPGLPLLLQGVCSDPRAASVWVVCPQRLPWGRLALAPGWCHTGYGSGSEDTLRLLTPSHRIAPFALAPGALPGSCL